MFAQIWIKPPKKTALGTDYRTKEFTDKLDISHFKQCSCFSEYLQSVSMLSIHF